MHRIDGNLLGRVPCQTCLLYGDGGRVAGNLEQRVLRKGIVDRGLATPVHSLKFLRKSKNLEVTSTHQPDAEKRSS